MERRWVREHNPQHAIPKGVTNVLWFAFLGCARLPRVTLPNRTATIGYSAFYGCNSLISVHLPESVRSLGSYAFAECSSLTSITVPFGVRTNRFGFTITGTANIPMVVEASPALTGPEWVSLQSCTLTNGALYFSDPQWTNYPTRFYRIRSP